MSEVEIIDLDSSNVCDHVFCGYRNPKQEGYRRKTEWLKKRFHEGMRVKVLHAPDEGDVGFVEYIPGEYTWRPIEAAGYLTIHCIMIFRRKHKASGYGSLLLEQCLRDAKKMKANGVAVVTSKGTWMAGAGLFVKHGFEAVDSAPPSFELFARKMKKGPLPRFKGGWEKKARSYGKGLVIIRSDQCPCVAKCAREILETAQRLGIDSRVKELTTCKQAQNAPSPYGIFNIVYNGRLIADHPIGNTRFRNIMKQIAG
jgi:L-amino acid N-acyltransferase YncA